MATTTPMTSAAWRACWRTTSCWCALSPLSRPPEGGSSLRLSRHPLYNHHGNGSQGSQTRERTLQKGAGDTHAAEGHPPEPSIALLHALSDGCTSSLIGVRSACEACAVRSGPPHLQVDYLQSRLMSLDDQIDGCEEQLNIELDHRCGLFDLSE